MNTNTTVDTGVDASRSELLPCPFCASAAAVSPRCPPRVICTGIGKKCPLVGYTFKREEWNARAAANASVPVAPFAYTVEGDTFEGDTTLVRRHPTKNYNIPLYTHPLAGAQAGAVEVPAWLDEFMKHYRLAPADWDTLATWFRDAHKERIELRERVAFLTQQPQASGRADDVTGISIEHDGRRVNMEARDWLAAFDKYTSASDRVQPVGDSGEVTDAMADNKCPQCGDDMCVGSFCFTCKDYPKECPHGTPMRYALNCQQCFDGAASVGAGGASMSAGVTDWHTCEEFSECVPCDGSVVLLSSDALAELERNINNLFTFALAGSDALGGLRHAVRNYFAEAESKRLLHAPMINGILVDEIAEMLESYTFAISDCTPKLDVRCERFHYIPRIQEIVEQLRARTAPAASEHHPEGIYGGTSVSNCNCPECVAARAASVGAGDAKEDGQ